MTKKQIHTITVSEDVKGFGDYWLNLGFLGKGKNEVLATNTMTQIGQSQWKHCFEGEVYSAGKPGTSGAARLASIMLGFEGENVELKTGDGSMTVTPEIRNNLLSGLLASRMSPSRAGLLASMIYDSLSAEDQEIVLSEAFSDDSERKAYKAFFKASSNLAKAITTKPEPKAKRKKSKKSIAFASVAFATPKRQASAEDLANAVDLASGGKGQL